MDAATGAVLKIFSGHRGAITYSAFSSDGFAFLTAGDYPDYTVKLWSPDSGALLELLPVIRVQPTPLFFLLMDPKCWLETMITLSALDINSGSIVRTSTDIPGRSMQLLSPRADHKFYPGQAIQRLSSGCRLRRDDTNFYRLFKYSPPVAFCKDSSKILIGSSSDSCAF